MSTQQVSGHCKTGACGSFNLDGVNLGDKTMREIMDASGMGQKWATNILNADRTQIKQYYVLNPSNSRQNLYGALRLGINANRGFNSSDTTVTKKLGEWLQNLNKQFPGMTSYTPESLGQRAADLKAAADCIGANTTKLASLGELTAQDAQYLNALVEGLQQYAAAATKLHTAVCAGPDITKVTLNIQPQKH